MMHLLPANCYIYASKLSLFFASNIVFCRIQVRNMEIGTVPLWVRSHELTWLRGGIEYEMTWI